MFVLHSVFKGRRSQMLILHCVFEGRRSQMLVLHGVFEGRRSQMLVFHWFSQENERSEAIWETWAGEAKFLENGRVQKAL